MDEFLVILKKLYSQSKSSLIKFYNKLNFLLKKQLTLQKIYEPFTEDKIKINENLSKKLSDLKNENTVLVKNTERLHGENKLLQSKIEVMQNLLIKK